MRTTESRLAQLERRLRPPACPGCLHLVGTHPDGTPWPPIPPTCAHGRPWTAIRRYIGVDLAAV